MYHEIVLAGVAISLIFSELTGLSPAGLVVPGYIALCLQTPRRVVYTLIIALLAWAAAKLLSRWMILYGRRRFAVLILLSFLLNELVVGTGLLPYDPGMIGVLVPGIIANEVEKQGLWSSLLSLSIVVAILVLLMLWKGMVVFPV